MSHTTVSEVGKVVAWQTTGTCNYLCKHSLAHVLSYIAVILFMSPVHIEHKFDSLREHWDKRKGIKWLLTVI